MMYLHKDDSDKLFIKITKGTVLDDTTQFYSSVISRLNINSFDKFTFKYNKILVKVDLYLPINVFHIKITDDFIFFGNATGSSISYLLRCKVDITEHVYKSTNYITNSKDMVSVSYVNTLETSFYLVNTNTYKTLHGLHVNVTNVFSFISLWKQAKYSNSILRLIHKLYCTGFNDYTLYYIFTSNGIELVDILGLKKDGVNYYFPSCIDFLYTIIPEYLPVRFFPPTEFNNLSMEEFTRFISLNFNQYKGKNMRLFVSNPTLSFVVDL